MSAGWALRDSGDIVDFGTYPFPVLAYDSLRRRQVVAEQREGNRDGPIKTWELDSKGPTWYVRESGHRAQPRSASATMAFDSQRGVMVLFGAGPNDGSNLSETWEYKVRDLAATARGARPPRHRTAPRASAWTACAAQARLVRAPANPARWLATKAPVRLAAAGTEVPGSCGAGQACAAGGSCKAKNGTACSSASGCASGFCVDGVCCDSALRRHLRVLQPGQSRWQVLCLCRWQRSTERMRPGRRRLPLNLQRRGSL